MARKSKRKGKHPRKPIGEDGPIRIENIDGTQVVKEWDKFKYPSDKKGQEREVAEAFLRAFKEKIGTDFKLDPLAEDDFDFAIIGGGEKRYLELQEIVIPPPKRGTPPYVEKEQVLKAGKFADTITSAIGPKIRKYPRTKQPLDLLLYYTHWRFKTNDTVVKLLAHFLSGIEHPFSRVYVLSRFDAKASRFEIAFPATELLIGFDPSAARKERYINVDPAQVILEMVDGNTSIELRFSSETMRKFMKR